LQQNFIFFDVQDILLPAEALPVADLEVEGA
jgi:hypothetical protein